VRRLLTAFVSAAVLSVLAVAPAPAASPTWPTLGQPPLGANDWSCRPTADRPTPVIIVHGTFGDQKSLLDRLSFAMVSAGYCVYSFDYGNRATAPIEQSADELKTFTGQVLQATGAAKVSMVGHSQGGMMPRYYIKFLGGDAVVDDLVGLSPSNHGTTVTGDPNNPLTGPMMTRYCPACVEQSAGSAFLTNLNAGDETPGSVSYTNVTTRYDEVVVPHTSGYLTPDAQTTNLTLQDVCAVDTSDHLQIPMSGTAIAIVLDALGRVGPADPAYTGCG
jgi:triacylglycerol esterase/lipase EstA (alpha/beta hydrolase family)